MVLANAHIPVVLVRRMHNHLAGCVTNEKETAVANLLGPHQALVADVA